ncbi:MAG: ABC transporter permease [Verrucomicrobia bacterium]|nr:ABC transporter permease [Verrucomicrobiota bacterium]
MRGRLAQMLKKEFIHIFRDFRLRGLVLVAPVVQLMIFGYAVSTDVRDIATGIYDLDNSIQSREIMSRFTNSRYFTVSSRIYSEDAARSLMDHGTVKVIIRINKGFGNDVVAGRAGNMQIILDGTDSNTAGIVLNYAAQITAGYSRDITIRRLAGTTGNRQLPAAIELRNRPWFNENLLSRNFYVPGVMASLLMLITLLLTCLSVVREKEIGTIEQIMVTPITPMEFIIGKTLPFVLVGMFDALLIAAVAVFWFEVPLRGSLLLLFGSALLYLMSGLGIGLLISTISRTQQQAMMTGFFVFMPALLLSGFMFPIENMPEPIQLITYIDPLRYFLVIVRGIFLKGVGASILWPQLAALAVIGASLLWLASTRIRKTMK